MRFTARADSAKGMGKKFKTPADAAPFDWALLAGIIIVGGFSFAMIHTAVSTLPPAVIATGRLWVAAGFLYIVMRLSGRNFPPLFQRVNGRLRLRRRWGSIIAVGASGYVLPFFLFPWAQQYVESGLAGIYMAFMPIWTLALAFFFADESVNAQKLFGFILGFAGVVVLMGPDVLKGFAHSDVQAQAGLLLATFLYAASTIFARRAATMPPRVFAAGVVLTAAILASPALLLADLEPSTWTWASLLSVVGLGVGPTGLGAILIIVLIRRAGAGFMSLANYIIPVWAVGVGAALFHERLELSAFIALAVILAGVAITQHAPLRRNEAPLPAGTGDALADSLEAVTKAEEKPAQMKI